MPANNTEIEKRLWDAADELRANSRLKASEYSVPVLGLIFLRYADEKFAHADKELRASAARSLRLPTITEDDYRARGALYIPEQARFASLLRLPEGHNLGKAISEAMKAIEEHNPDLKDVLPKTYNRLGNATLRELMRIFHSIPMDIGRVQIKLGGETCATSTWRPGHDASTFSCSAASTIRTGACAPMWT